jgi:class 3 adenylate cyclase
MEKPVILCVDDEKVVLDSLRTQLKNLLKKDYTVEIAESGQEALEIIEDLQEEFGSPPCVVISDMIMPNMKGDELLAIVREKCPETLSILLTGQAEKTDIINAINTAGLYRYIPKPWEVEDLNLTVREAISAFINARELELQKEQLIQMNHNLERKVQERTAKILEQKQELENEKIKSDELLLNILPREVADELKEHGKALPTFYDHVTVLFSDLVGFTQIAEKMTPEELVLELDTCFHAFDEIVENNKLEKIKTIGDGYMAAGGLPIRNNSNPIDAVNAAQEMIKCIDEINEKRSLEGKDIWQVRIGIHTGELIAGVVGKNKFVYDIWGDTVNIASRMESSGEPGKINISGTTYGLIKDHFECTHRGKIELKGKGVLDTYFVADKILNVLKQE